MLETAYEWLDRSCDIVARSSKLGAEELKRFKRLKRSYERPIIRCSKILAAAESTAAAAAAAAEIAG